MDEREGRGRLRAPLAVVAALALLALAAPGPASATADDPVAGGADPAAAGPEAEVAEAEVAVVVEIGDDGFHPALVEVPVGAVVTWRHVGQQPATVTADDGSFESSPGCTPPDPAGCLAGGEGFAHTFTAAGTWTYRSRSATGPLAGAFVGEVVVAAAEPCPAGAPAPGDATAEGAPPPPATDGATTDTTAAPPATDDPCAAPTTTTSTTAPPPPAPDPTTATTTTTTTVDPCGPVTAATVEPAATTTTVEGSTSSTTSTTTAPTTTVSPTTTTTGPSTTVAGAADPTTTTTADPAPVDPCATTTTADPAAATTTTTTADPAAASTTTADPAATATTTTAPVTTTTTTSTAAVAAAGTSGTDGGSGPRRGPVPVAPSSWDLGAVPSGDGSPTASAGFPAHLRALMDSVVRTPPGSTRALAEAADLLVSAGIAPDEAVRLAFGRFPVGGEASYTHDWWFPRYGPVWRLHQGTDIFAATGTPVRAPAAGTVTVADGGLGGLSVRVTEPDGTYWYLAHLSGIAHGVVDGLAVEVGDVVGYVGDTGNARGGPPHLHLEVHPAGGTAIDPKPVLDQLLAEAVAALPTVLADALADAGRSETEAAEPAAGQNPLVVTVPDPAAEEHAQAEGYLALAPADPAAAPSTATTSAGAEGPEGGRRPLPEDPVLLAATLAVVGVGLRPRVRPVR